MPNGRDAGAEQDRSDILKLIEAETAAFWAKDYDAWARCWVQQPHVRRWGWWAAGGGMTVRDGWEQQADRMQALMAANPKPNRSAAEVRRQRLMIRVSGQIAWVTFDQHAPATGDGMDISGLTHELRVLEKEQGKWKIAGLFFLQRSLDYLEAPSVRVDENSRVLWLNDAAERELSNSHSIGITAGRLRATDRTANQRLRAAIRWAATLDEGLYPTKGVLPIVLDGGYQTPATLCWVIAESGIVLVTLNDRGMIEKALNSASLIYGITAAQRRLAHRLSAGDDVVSAADTLGISVNTARTHLRRMYERTGVRNQSTLVRVLLSVSPP